ncbi:MAG: hypothetical protein ACRCYQ_12485 [Nocardioides sp.]
MMNIRRAAARALAIGAIAAGSALATSAPSEAAPRCLGAGYLCFKDFATGEYGNFRYDNDNWGRYGWNDRADWFRNDGVNCSVRIYENARPDPRGRGLGAGYRIGRGEVFQSSSWYNRVSSNYWC